MSQRGTNDDNNSPAGAIKDPDNWKTGDDPATPSQRSYLETLATQAGEEVDAEELTKAEASKRIDELRGKTGLDDKGNS